MPRQEIDLAQAYSAKRCRDGEEISATSNQRPLGVMLKSRNNLCLAPQIGLAADGVSFVIRAFHLNYEFLAYFCDRD